MAKAPKAPKQAKEKAPKPPKAAKAKPGHNEAGDDERRALFLSDVAKRKKLLEAKDAAVAELRNHAKYIKADGFTVSQVDFAIRLQTPEGEESGREKLAEQIQAAKWVGSPIGTQFSFDLVDRTPAVDEGKVAFMNNEPAKPPYDPSTPQYAKWLEGHSTAQSAALKKGIKPLDTASGWGDDRDPGRPLDA